MSVLKFYFTLMTDPPRFLETHQTFLATSMLNRYAARDEIVTPIILICVVYQFLCSFACRRRLRPDHSFNEPGRAVV
jgi:hypothetical protein